LAQKLRWRKATKSNFCDKVFVGFELLVMWTPALGRFWSKNEFNN